MSDFKWVNGADKLPPKKDDTQAELIHFRTSMFKVVILCLNRDDDGQIAAKYSNGFGVKLLPGEYEWLDEGL